MEPSKFEAGRGLPLHAPAINGFGALKSPPQNGMVVRPNSSPASSLQTPSFQGMDKANFSGGLIQEPAEALHEGHFNGFLPLVRTRVHSEPQAVHVKVSVFGGSVCCAVYVAWSAGFDEVSAPAFRSE